MTASELRNRLRGPLSLELRSGCRDTAVKGGLERLLETVGGPFGDVRALMDGYSALSPEARAERVEQALVLLGPVEVSEAAVQKPNGVAKPQSVQKVPRPVAEASIEPDFSSAELDAELSQTLLNVGHTAAKKLAPLGLKTYRDLLFYYPKRYEDRRALPSFSALGEQESVTVVGTVTGRKLTKARSGMTVVRAFLEDTHGARLGVVWFNQAWLEKQLFPGQRIIVTGKVKRRGSAVELSAAHFEIDDDAESLSAGRTLRRRGSVRRTCGGRREGYSTRSRWYPTICPKVFSSAFTSSHSTRRSVKFTFQRAKRRSRRRCGDLNLTSSCFSSCACC